MNHLENKTLMILVMIVLIVSSSLFAGVSKLNRMADDIHQEFLVGEKKDGLSIQHDLDTRIECARNIVTLANKYDINTTRANAAVQVFEQVDSILKYHIDVRHIRGGQSTKKKYKKLI